MGSIAANEVFETLKKQIISYERTPGTRLTEAELGQQFAVSRTPIREALRRLAQEGWVVISPHQGYQVRTISLRSIEELYEVRIALEQLAVRLTSRTATPEVLRQLRQYAELDARSANAWPALVEKIERFHEALAEASGNSELARQWRHINERIHVTRIAEDGAVDRARAIFSQHAQIVDLLKDGKVDDATSLLESHLRESKLVVFDQVKEALARIYLGSDEAHLLADTNSKST